MPLEELKLIWTKAVDLLSSPDDSIVPCPGFQSGFAVASAQDPAKPHIVIPLASGEVRCRGCPQYYRLSICSHTVAVAEKKSILWKFLPWYTKNRDKPNFSQAANQGMPDGRGKKGERAPRKQRSKKQGQNPLPTDFVDRLHTVTANTVQPRSAMVQSASIMPPAVQPVVSAAMPLAAMQSTDLTIQPATARQAVPSAAATRQEMPSAATARQAVPSAATVRQAVPSAATVRQEVPSAATDRQAVPSAATARQEVPSAAIARQEVPSSATARQAVQALPSTAMYCMQPTAMQPLSAAYSSQPTSNSRAVVATDAFNSHAIYQVSNAHDSHSTTNSWAVCGLPVTTHLNMHTASPGIQQYPDTSWYSIQYTALSQWQSIPFDFPTWEH